MKKSSKPKTQKIGEGSFVQNFGNADQPLREFILAGCTHTVSLKSSHPKDSLFGMKTLALRTLREVRENND